MAEINKIIVGSEEYPIQLAEDQVFGYHEVADKIRKNAAAAASLEKQLDAYSDMWYDDSLYGYETTNSYSIRETANGAKVVNGSRAVLKKVEGNTVIGKNLCKPFSMRTRITGEDSSPTIRTWNGSSYRFRLSRSNYLWADNPSYIKVDNNSGEVTFLSDFQWYGVAFDVPCKPNVEYRISVKNTGQMSFFLGSTFFDKAGNHLGGGNDGKGTVSSVTAPQNAAWLIVTVHPAEESISQEISFNNIQVEEGTEVTEYEPYFEGLKHITFNGIRSRRSKNLCKPISQRTLTEIKGTNGSAPNGKRYWSEDTYTIGITHNNQLKHYDTNYVKEVTANSVTFNTGNPYYGLGLGIPCDGGKTYTFSAKVESVSPLVYFRWMFCKDDGSVINYAQSDVDQKNKRGSATIETPNEAKWIGIVVCGHNADTTKNGNITVSNMQLEEGSEATEYEPYKEEKSILEFPETELPLYATIDFETKKITDYGVTIVCDTELISKAKFTRNGSGFILVNVLPKEEEPKRIGVSSIGYAVSGTGEPRIQVAYTGGPKNILFIGLPFWKGMNDSDDQDFKGWLQKLADAGTPLTIRYLSTIATTESFDEENEYTVWKGGTEQILGNSLEFYDTHPTITQDYLIIKQEENN